MRIFLPFIFLTVLFFFVSEVLLAQTTTFSTAERREQEIDSLENTLTLQLSDSLKLENTIKLFLLVLNQNPKQALDYLEKARLWNRDSLYQGRICNARAIFYWQQGEYNQALVLYKKAEQEFEKRGDIWRLADVSQNLGLLYSSRKEFEQAHYYYRKAQAIYENQTQHPSFPKNYAAFLSNRGILAMRENKLDSALFFHREALLYASRAQDVEGEARAYQNLGNVFLRKDSLVEARLHFQKSLSISEEANLTQGKIFNHNSLATIFIKNKEYAQALPHAEASFELAERVGRKESMRNSLQNLVTIYQMLGDFKTAFAYLQMQQQVKDSLLNEQKIREQFKIEYQNDLFKREQENEKLKSLAQIQENTIKQQRIFSVLFSILFLFLILILILFVRSQQKIKRDNFILQKQTRIIQEQNFKLQQNSEKKISQILDSSLDACVGSDAEGKIIIWSLAAERLFGWKEQEVMGKKLSEVFIPQQHRSAHEEGMQRYLTTQEPHILNQRVEITALRKDGTHFPVELTVNAVKIEAETLFAAFIRDITQQKADAAALRQSQEKALEAILTNKKLIEEQNRLLEEQVQKRTQSLQEAYEMIAAHNEAVAASIHYGARIQNALLPRPDVLAELFPKHFIFFKPRDVVSGDFYWTRRLGSLRLIAAIDCTGHGVPGAFMSMIGNDLLHEIVGRRKITRPDGILNELHKGIRNALQQDSTQNQDGMDISVCCIDDSKQVLYFAGAKNGLIYFQNQELFQIKGDKFSIGGEQLEAERIFTLHTIPLQTQTTCYLFSDGYPDQFGGKQGKKMMTKNLKNFLSTIQTQEMQDQAQAVKQHFYEWKGTQEQVDDVLLIGFTV
ncbi:PAS domain S-box protein [Hugenholtzia roseola]|uniref:PAS domain S-box protein n=1 Tax=Hugenholtzia roseola TaxID=1002 RepID=UPI0003FBBD12|nr:PAS domain S-box protein [Hugenholtzia roseola]